MGNMEPLYKRVVVKVSGEALADSRDKTILDQRKIEETATAIKQVADRGVQVAVVVGAGNIWRGRLADKIGIDRSTGDYMGMLGTIINALALQNAFEKKGLPTRVMSSINVPQVCEPYIRRKAISHLESGHVVIFAGGTGNPYFTTDTTASLRALEIGADSILMAKNGIDGVYDKDPNRYDDAVLLTHLSYREVLERKLEVMDLTAVAMLETSDIVIRVFGMEDASCISKAIRGEIGGTTIGKE